MHVRHREVSLAHLLGEPLNSILLVAEDDSLCDGERIVEVAQSLKFVIILLDCNKELLDAIESNLVSFDQNLNWIVHKLISHL